MGRVAGIVEGYIHKCRRCAARGGKHHERHPDAVHRRCPNCNMLLWPAPITVRMKFHELRHSTNTLLAALGVPETVRADILGHRTRAMTRRYTHLTVEQMRAGFRKLDAASPISVAQGAPVAPAGYLKWRLAPPREDPSNDVPLALKRTPMQRVATRGCPSTDAGLTPPSPAKKKPRTQAKNIVNPGPYWSGTPGSNRRPSPWQGEQADSPTVPAPHQPSPNSGDHSGHEAVVDAPPRQPSPSVHNGCVPQVFQDGARPLEVAQVAMLLGWTKDVVRAACERGELTHTRDHLNAYSIPCSVVAAAAGWHVRNEQPRGSSSSAKWERQDEATGPGTPPRRRP